MKLWEAEHSYYCNDGNYYARESVESKYRSWTQFLAEEGNSDFDLNLVFRWDWREGEGWDLAEFNGDENYRNGELKIYWMGQRKGLYRYSTVEVCRADEPRVREWLEQRWEHLEKLWEPIERRKNAQCDRTAETGVPGE